MTYNADNNNKRCLVCDFCKETDGGPSRSFIWDQVEQGWNCNHCQREIQNTIEDAFKEVSPNYWIGLTERPPTDAEILQREFTIEELPASVDPLQARLNAYLEVDDGS